MGLGPQHPSSGRIFILFTSNVSRMTRGLQITFVDPLSLRDIRDVAHAVLATLLPHQRGFPLISAYSPSSPLGAAPGTRFEKTYERTFDCHAFSLL